MALASSGFDAGTAEGAAARGAIALGAAGAVDEYPCHLAVSSPVSRLRPTTTVAVMSAMAMT